MLATILHNGALLAALLSGAVLCALLIRNLARPGTGLWPAEGRRRKALVLGLFRFYCGTMALVALTTLFIHGPGLWPRYAIGVPLMLGAYALSLVAYGRLGKANTYGGAEGLETGGLYAYSRNPGYVGSLAAALGLAIAAGSWVVLGLAGGLFAIYFLFALNEERWLVKGYGREFVAYMRRTPRFLDWRSVERVREELEGR